jgi:hypothetical protein
VVTVPVWVQAEIATVGECAAAIQEQLQGLQALLAAGQAAWANSQVILRVQRNR